MIRKGYKKRTYQYFISICKQKHDLSDVTVIKEKTVCEQVQWNTKSSTNSLKSPLLSIKPYVVPLIIQLASMHIPLTVERGLQLCNQLSVGQTNYEKATATFKENHLSNAKTWAWLLEGTPETKQTSH